MMEKTGLPRLGVQENAKKDVLGTYVAYVAHLSVCHELRVTVEQKLVEVLPSALALVKISEPYWRRNSARGNVGHVFFLIDQKMANPFEGAEKLLEIWFAPSPAQVPDALEKGRTGLRKIDSTIWEEMLSIVRCKILSTVHGNEMDAYLLR
jgi:hypothetical protein